MSRARHKARAEGGNIITKQREWDVPGRSLSSKPVWNSGGDQNAAKEAEEKKKGGRVKGEGAAAKKRGDVKARSHPGAHKGRAKGGRIGANLMPLSTAARVKHVTRGEQPEEGTQ